MSTLSITTKSYKIISHANEASLSSRLTYALDRLKMSQSELARKIGVKPQVIQYLCTSHANKSKFAYEIANALEINPEWLIAGKGPMLFSLPADKSTQPKVPLLSWQQVISWLNHDKSFEVNAPDYIHINSTAATNSFAVKITDTSMVPRFEVGTLLIIDPSLEAKSGDFVIVLTGYQEQPVVRQLMSKNGKIWLMPSNLAIYKEIKLTAEDKILGIVRQTYYEFIR